MKYYQEKINDQGTIAVDDTILIKGVPATAGSHILSGFKPLFSAEAVTRLEDRGYTVSGKTCVGEFGLDLVGEFSYDATQEGTLQGAAASLVKEGALQGAAASLVKNGEVKAALGVDMNGAPRRAAALADICFLKPTYGTVSRYGIISCAASGEQVGVYAGNTDSVAEIMGVIAGHDDKDGTSLPAKKYEYNTDEDVNEKRVAIITNMAEKADGDTNEKIASVAEALKESGVIVSEITFDYAEQASTAWQILMSAETCNNLSRFDGVKYGHRSDTYKNIDELYVNSRTEGFNFLTKSTIMYGSDVLSKSRYDDCYDKSLRVRRVTADYMNSLFEQYDAILMPACSTKEFEQYDIKDAFSKVFGESIFTAPANLTGIPALSCCGVQIMGKQYSESLLLSLMKKAEERRG